MTVDGGLACWAATSGKWRTAGHARGKLRFAFYGRVSTEDWQDPGYLAGTAAGAGGGAGSRARAHRGGVLR
jgi:hypothetical protein